MEFKTIEFQNLCLSEMPAFRQLNKANARPWQAAIQKSFER